MANFSSHTILWHFFAYYHTEKKLSNILYYYISFANYHTEITFWEHALLWCFCKIPHTNLHHIHEEGLSVAPTAMCLVWLAICSSPTQYIEKRFLTIVQLNCCFWSCWSPPSKFWQLMGSVLIKSTFHSGAIWPDSLQNKKQTNHNLLYVICSS